MSFSSKTSILSKIMIVYVLTVCMLSSALGHSHHQTLMTSRSHVEDLQHIGHHLQGIADVNKMAEEELRFHYFKLHDDDHNNKLDGCELIKSLLHFHDEERVTTGHHHHGMAKIFGNMELEHMIDPIMKTDDANFDGFIDYPEFVAAQKSRGF